MSRKKRIGQINLDITQEIIDAAIPRNSGACVYADAIKAQLPRATRVAVDLATMRFTDPATNERYVYLTPEVAQMNLFAFDRGVPPVAHTLRLGRPIRVTRTRTSHAKRRDREARLLELEGKAKHGTLTVIERKSLALMRRNNERARSMPTSEGPREIDERTGTVHGPAPRIPVNERRLLPARERVFGARIANPSLLDGLLDAAKERGRREALGEE